MAIKQRALRKLNTTKNHLLRAIGEGSKAALGEVCRNLTEARDLYREGLSQQNYIAYEEICDGLILAVRKMMEDGEAGGQEEVLALCLDLLQHLEQETEKEQNFKKEIVFLPYKASMFDSLESVWKAADEDKEHCNAYVIPIPYADRNLDGSAAEWHCERAEFPSYVPTLDWRAVNLKKMHPDVIFYHNAYEDCNLVTSVEPSFYSANLKECTDKLVYIPYFVLEEIDPEDEKAVESIRHFIMLPGVVHTDLVIVQSEKMREAYIKVLANVTTQNDRKFWEKRILGLGSPKFDKVANSKREDFELPEEWKRLIRGRKTILYNTGLSAMLKHTNTYCQKICSVLDTFRNQEDVVLWWRPHPLMKATLQSMRPDILKEYEEIVTRYREENWGIFDDTVELERAIAWTDGYYGDGSSVVQLYNRIGKTVLLQDSSFEGLENANFELQLICAAREGKYLYLPGYNVNALFKMNIDNGDISFESLIPFESLNHDFWGMYYSTIKVENEIYLFPLYSKDVVTYNLHTKKYRKIIIQTVINFDNAVMKSFYVNGYVFILTYKGNVIKLKNGNVVEEKNIVCDCAHYDAAILLEKEIWAVCVGTGSIAIINLEDFEIQIKHIFDTKMLYMSLDNDNNKLWFIDEYGAVYFYDISKDNYKRVTKIRLEEKLRNMIYRDNKIFCFHSRTAKYLVVDVNSNSMKYINPIPADKANENEWYIAEKLGEDIFVLQRGTAKYIFKIPRGSDRAILFKNVVKLKDEDGVYWPMAIAYEDCLYNLKGYLKWLSLGENVTIKDATVSRESYGEIIKERVLVE